MKPEEIEELLEAAGWSKAHLADEMELGEFTVHRWLMGKGKVPGPASVLMRFWLYVARIEGADALNEMIAKVKRELRKESVPA